MKQTIKTKTKAKARVISLASFAVLLVLAACAIATAQLTPKTFEPAGAPLGTGAIQTMPTRGGALIGVLQFLGPPNTVDLRSTGTRDLYTSPVGQNTLITGVVFVAKSVASVTVDPVVGLGVASGESDVLTPTTLTGLATGKCLSLSNLGMGAMVRSGETLKVGTDTGATAAACDVDIILIGGVVPQ